jgi:hypothetical protein
VAGMRWTWAYAWLGIFCCSIALMAFGVFPELMSGASSLAMLATVLTVARHRQRGTQLFGMKRRKPGPNRMGVLLGLSAGLALSLAYVLVVVLSR